MQADFAMGVSFFKREDETLPEYFMSFSPMAPFFGVPWRFAPAFGVKQPDAAPAPAAKPQAKSQPKRKAPAPKVIEAVAEPAPAPAPAAAPAPAPAPEPAPTLALEPVEGGKPAMLYDAAPAKTDDLKLIKGVGPKLEKELNGLGIFTFAQVAVMTPENLSWVDDNLSAFKGRSLRDDWVGQAAALLEG